MAWDNNICNTSWATLFLPNKAHRQDHYKIILGEQGKKEKERKEKSEVWADLHVPHHRETRSLWLRFCSIRMKIESVVQTSKKEKERGKTIVMSLINE